MQDENEVGNIIGFCGRLAINLCVWVVLGVLWMWRKK